MTKREFEKMLWICASSAFREHKRTFIKGESYKLVEHALFTEKAETKDKEERKKIAIMILHGKYEEAARYIRSPDFKSSRKKEVLENLNLEKPDEIRPYVAVNCLVSSLNDEMMNKRILAAHVLESKEAYVSVSVKQLEDIVENIALYKIYSKLRSEWEKKYGSALSFRDFAKAYCSESYKSANLPETTWEKEKIIIRAYQSLEKEIHKVEKTSFFKTIKDWYQKNPEPSENKVYAIG